MTAVCAESFARWLDTSGNRRAQNIGGAVLLKHISPSPRRRETHIDRRIRKAADGTPSHRSGKTRTRTRNADEVESFRISGVENGKGVTAGGRSNGNNGWRRAAKSSAHWKIYQRESHKRDGGNSAVAGICNVGIQTAVADGDTDRIGADGDRCRS